MISVYAIIKSGDKKKNTGVWRGTEEFAPEMCVITDNLEVHYWIENGDNVPQEGEKCMCKKEKYNEN